MNKGFHRSTRPRVNFTTRYHGGVSVPYQQGIDVPIDVIEEEILNVI